MVAPKTWEKLGKLEGDSTTGEKRSVWVGMEGLYRAMVHTGTLGCFKEVVTPGLPLGWHLSSYQVVRLSWWAFQGQKGHYGVSSRSFS